MITFFFKNNYNCVLIYLLEPFVNYIIGYEVFRLLSIIYYLAKTI